MTPLPAAPRAVAALALGLGALGCSSRPASRAPDPSAVLICPEGKNPGGLGCSSAPVASASSSPPRRATPAPPARPTEGLDALVGSWFGEDSDATASYELSISPEGAFTQFINTLDPSSGRPPGRCHQDGIVTRAEGAIVWNFQINTCNSSYEGGEESDQLVEVGPRHFVISTESYQVHYSRTR
ncbi:MAG: hypothetical protein MUF64_22715 [Polyangiaceae bacterium]|nr:hypothetical protein [Polyangiaceae bacterium]